MEPSAAAPDRVAAPFPKKLEAILFDIDGTLADTDPVHFKTFVDVLQAQGFNGGVPISLDFFRQKISGRQNCLICQDLFPQWDDERAEEFAVHKEATFRERAADQLEPMPGLGRLAKWCEDKSLRRAAVTNAPRLNAEFILKCISRSSWFDEVVIGDECERGKPDPCPYLTAMSRLGVRPESCIAFEDSPSGAQSAVAAGLYTVGILSGQSASKLKDAGCSILIDSYNAEELWSLLEGVSVP